MGIVYNFWHHPYAMMTKAIMLSLECVDILKKLFYRQHVLRFDICIIYSRR